MNGETELALYKTLKMTRNYQPESSEDALWLSVETRLARIEQLLIESAEREKRMEKMLHALTKTVEWSGNDSDDLRCPICNSYKDEDHEDNCSFKQLETDNG